MVMGVLSSALDLAKAAVSHDEQGMLPEKVLPYYRKVRESTGQRLSAGQRCGALLVDDPVSLDILTLYLSLTKPSLEMNQILWLLRMPVIDTERAVFGLAIKREGCFFPFCQAAWLSWTALST